MTKLIDYYIDEIREQTENEDFNGSVGISEEEFIRALNDAQYRLHAKIVAQHPNVYILEKEVDCISGTQEYNVPSLAFVANRIVQIEYSYDGSSDNYIMLKPDYLRNRYTNSNGDPQFYVRRGGKILLSPTPDNAGSKIRVTYIAKPKRLDKRRGIIKAVTTAASAISSLEVNYVNGSSVDSTELKKRIYLTVVDKYGNQKMDNILLSSIDSSVTYDATLTIDSSFTFESGETIAADDYILSGRYATTHPDVEDSTERYLIAYAEWKILARDSSVDSQEKLQELVAMEDDIIASYADMSGDDIFEVPQINLDEDWL